MKLKLAAMFFGFAALLPVLAMASASPKAIAVLNAEKTRLKAFTVRDFKTLQNLLSENYVHVDAAGRLHYREGELSAIRNMNPPLQVRSEQTVDFAGDVAIVHGISAHQSPGKTARLRYTDVYRWLNNRWQTISAQETPIR